MGKLNRMYLFFCLALLSPWMGVFHHGSSEIHRDDGPAALILLTVTTVTTFIMFALYSVVSGLLSKFRTSRALYWIAITLMFCVAGFCVGLSLLWAKVSLDGEWLFMLAAGGYAVLSVRLVLELVSVIKYGVVIHKNE
jgi:hypothetical protein